jgi:hypothetical protein
MAIIKINNNNNCWQECGETETLLHCWWKWKLVQPLLKAAYIFFKKLKIELSHNPVIPLLDLPKGM